MPSRRAVVAGSGALASGLGLGWLATGGLAHTGRVVRKRIDVSWTYRGGERWNGQLLQAVRGPDGSVDLGYDPTYVGSAVSGPGAVTVSESLHERLADEFRSVEYRLGVCGTAPGEGCAYSVKRAGRPGFNRARLGDEATVTDVGDRLVVHRVTEASGWRDADVHEFDFDERHEAHGR